MSRLNIQTILSLSCTNLVDGELLYVIEDDSMKSDSKLHQDDFQVLAIKRLPQDLTTLAHITDHVTTCLEKNRREETRGGVKRGGVKRRGGRLTLVPSATIGVSGL